MCKLSLFVASSLGAALIGELVLSIHALVLGAGVPLFPAGAPHRALRLTGAVRRASGLVQTNYERLA